MSEENVNNPNRGVEKPESNPGSPKGSKRARPSVANRGSLKDGQAPRPSHDSRRRTSTPAPEGTDAFQEMEEYADATQGREDTSSSRDESSSGRSSQRPSTQSGTPQTATDSKTVSSSSSPQATSGRQSMDEGTANVSDAYNAEFSYYCAVLRTFAPSLSREYDKATTRLWMRKLFGPEYHPAVLKPKRNKYLLYLSITIYNDEAYGIFKQEPPCGKLPEIKDIPFERDFPPAAWETEVQWTDTLSELPEELKLSECYLHDQDGCPPRDEKLCEALDAEFQFFLWLSKPYVTLLPDPEEKTTAACWIQLLCGVASQREDCVALKEIRNDYMQTLLGYVHDLRVEGPFRLMPPAGPLPPLALLYEDCVDDTEYADPAGNHAEQFLAIQRLPESGAFAYINVTGELFENF